MMKLPCLSLSNTNIFKLTLLPDQCYYFEGSKFYENERKKEEQMKKRIEEQKLKIEKITDKQLQQGLIEVHV